VGVQARVRCELFVADVDPIDVRPRDIDARLWTDAIGQDRGRYVPMHLVLGADGTPVLSGKNLLFESELFALQRTGAFNYRIELSADSHVEAGRKEWIPINDIAENRDGVIVVSPQWVQRGPVVSEICARKVGARVENGVFHSGRIAYVTQELENIAADVIYLLPFYLPGFVDSHTGQDVRKGALGSVYAVRDFFQIDPQLITPLQRVNWNALSKEGLCCPDDVASLSQSARAELLQAVGRAELRALTRRAHALGKKVIFDLVLMQTSRDCPLIDTHPEFYVRDETGRPAIHRIAWLVYSDVALFDLAFNEPLQQYLLDVAPYWIENCDLDGVRIDASQTVDLSFLKRIKNRIQSCKPEALVLGETLCPLHEAVDVPVDMIYALMVDFHRDVEHARPLCDFLEEVHESFASGTVAMAYFENHDSPRATQVWRDKYRARLDEDEAARNRWQRTLNSSADPAQCMALLKNAQATLIDASAGAVTGTNLTRGFEWGSEWGEVVRTDFENETLLQPELRRESPHFQLMQFYRDLLYLRTVWPELHRGRVYYHRNNAQGGDVDDSLLLYVRYDGQGALLVAHNLDPVRSHSMHLRLDYLDADLFPTLQLDTYEWLSVESRPSFKRVEEFWRIELHPLESGLWRLF
tara:strand:+ start:897 stop:2816 length:1920 start_codon:yes stop_codon:yes gene_type:complete